ncbi:hypothetical protein [Streptomyces sp. SAI-127]|uniref:hypothetical protein n=1 Tax=Streptomyces sp. SAI-127 TaxID=2940543 RepID=UPI002472F0CF|nr:hypothetical protein [Streptomyces sp. SAI-127]MDH6489605.1 hypothetical protein [Streptomyces sp. SAI-127]
MNRDTEAVRARTVGVDVVRLTPLRDGAPDHTWAATYTADAPLDLTIAALYPTPNLALGPLERDHMGLLGLVAAFTSDPDLQRRDIPQALDRRLHHHANDGLAVETWTAERAATTGPRRWLYNLLPRWTWTPAEDWPLEELHRTTVHTTGKVTPNPGHTWPTPAPYEPRDNDPHISRYHCLTAITETPPPPAGYADPALAAWATEREVPHA